ncbi:MAG TPA: PTS sugar transporter subunit IIB [Symbiobacteriaceae bacterium]|nr:PTS sugar transporter subunit IIB [Symbiobacteriaceae bacterium]
MKILLVCAAGMSTSLLVQKMQKAATARNINVEIVAHASPDFEEIFRQFDVILLGPQVRFRKDDWGPLAEAAGIPLGVISPMDYGIMNGDKVLDSALNMLKSKQ